VQKVELKVVGGKSTWVGVGNGPFTDRYPNGIDASGTIMMQAPGKPAPKAGLTQSRMSATDVTKREFGSIAAPKGSIIVNNTEKNVVEIEITTKGMTGGTANEIDGKSGDGDDFTTDISRDKKTIVFKAKKGKELPPDQNVWMLIPKGPQPGQPGGKIYEGKVTTSPPAMPPAPAPAAPMVPATGGATGLSTIHYDSATAMLSFQPGSLTVAAYFDGSSTVTNGPDEYVIGSQIEIGDMQVLGPSSIVPGAYTLSDSGIALVQGGQVLLQAELTNNLLIPDPNHPEYSIVQGSLTVGEEGLPFEWGPQAGTMLQSKYIEEYFSDSSASDVFFQTNILTVTQNLTQDGDANGTVIIGSVAPNTGGTHDGP
jgi:hypothetical protein